MNGSEKVKLLSNYAVAVFSAAIALVLAHTFYRPGIAFSPFFLFYAAVAFSSWYGGAGPGILTIILGALAADLYVVAPAGAFWPQKPEEIGRLLLFASVGMLITILNDALRRSNRRCEAEAEAARKSEARARRLTEANLIGVFFSDLEGNVRSANGEFLRLIGHSSDDQTLAGTNWRSLTVPEHRHRDERAIEELRHRQVCSPFEKMHQLPDGRRVPVLCGCALVHETDDVVGFVLDLTQQKIVESELRKNQERLVALGAELTMAGERERRRIATVLHDSVVQMLALAKLRSNQLLGQFDENAEASSRLKEVCELIESSIAQSRTLTADLSPPVLYELGLAAAIQWLGDRLRSEHGVAFEVIGDREKMPISDETRIILFQAVRELMMNVVRHSGAARCVVEVRRDVTRKAIQISVEDHGRGFVSACANDYSKGGFGLFNVRQQLAYLAGSLRIAPRPGGGSVVTISAPLAIAQTETDYEHTHILMIRNHLLLK